MRVARIFPSGCLLPNTMLYFLLGFITSLTMVTSHTTKVVPTGWENMCTATEDANILGLYVDNVTTTSYHVMRMDCHVTGSSGTEWKLQTLQKWFFKPHDIALFVRVICSDGGKISLPWPMKVHGMIGLKVSHCLLTDKYADFNNTEISAIPEQLRVLEIRDSMWLRDASAFEAMTDPNSLASLSSDYDCGQDSTLEYEVFSNVTDQILPFEGMGKDAGLELPDAFNFLFDSSTETPKPGHLNENLGINDPKATDKLISDLNIDLDLSNQTNSTTENATLKAQQKFRDLLKSLESLDIQCNYKKLKVLDQSSPGLMPVDTFRIMVQTSTYPELRIMNFSRSGITDFPKELKNFRTHFPKLEYLDISKNYIRQIDLPAGQQGQGGSYTTLDVRYNEITNLSVDNLMSWAALDDVFIDIRNNPLHCDCRMEPVIKKIQSDDFLRDSLLKYDYLKNVQCAGPESVKGQTLGTVRLQCGANFAATSTKPERGISSSTVGVVIGCSLLSLVVIIAVAVVVLKYRQHRQKKEKLEDESTLQNQKSFRQKDIETALANLDNQNLKG